MSKKIPEESGKVLGLHCDGFYTTCAKRGSFDNVENRDYCNSGGVHPSTKELCSHCIEWRKTFFRREKRKLSGRVVDKTPFKILINGRVVKAFKTISALFSFLRQHPEVETRVPLECADRVFEYHFQLRAKLNREESNK